MSEGRSQLAIVLVLAGLVAAGWFLLPGANRPALALGALVGLLTAFVLLPALRDVKLPIAAGIAAGLVIFGFLMVHMTRSELAYIDLGTVADRVHAAAHAVAGLFGGMAARILWRGLTRSQGAAK